jgi:hypothetical protein
VDAGFEVRRSYGKAPVQAADGTKDPVAILVATSTVIASLTPALLKIITVLTRRPVVVKEWIAIPVETSSGGVVRDDSGAPILYWAERHRLLESAGPEGRITAKVSGPLGLSVEIDS